MEHLTAQEGRFRAEDVRGRGWQAGQLKLDRFMNDSRRIGVPHRGQGRSSCP